MKYIYCAIFLFSVGLYSQTITLTDEDILAFPGRGSVAAKGWGKNATGGRGLPVYFVTNLNDSGAGSLRQAETDIQNSGSGGNIIFRTGGISTITGEIVFSLNVDDISIYGQSAPGDGFTVYGDGIIMRGSNIIGRHLKIRAGNSDNVSLLLGGTNQNGTHSNYMLDHLSLSWGGNSGNFDIISNIGDLLNIHNNITLQNSLLSEGFNKNMLLYGQGISKISILNNAFTNTQERNIRTSVGDNNEYELINNYFYGFDDAIIGTAKNKFDVIGNVWEDSYAPRSVNPLTIYLSDCSSGNCPPSGDSDYTGSQVYANDNIDGGVAATLDTDATNALVGSRIDPSSYTPRSSSTVYDYVITNVGARSTMEGIDDYDQHQINDIINGSSGSFYSSVAQTTGLPSQVAGTPYTDTDNDGLSDAYETANGGDVVQSDRPATAVLIDGRVVDQSGVTNYATQGYTHLEIFMADLAKDWDSFTTNTPVPPPTNQSKKKKKYIPWW